MFNTLCFCAALSTVFAGQADSAQTGRAQTDPVKTEAEAKPTKTKPAETAAEPVVEVASVVVSLIEEVQVPARQRGVLADVKVEEGDFVEAGQMLAQIDSRDALLVKERVAVELRRAVARAKNTAGVRLSRKTLELAEAELERGLRSRKVFDKSVTEEEIQRRELAVARSKIEIEQAEHEVELAKIDRALGDAELAIAQRSVDLHAITTPIPGMIVQVNRRGGEWIEPGEPVVRVIRVNRLRAEGFLSADDVAASMIGSEVTLTVGLSKSETRQFSGVLRFVSPEVSPVDGRIRIWAEIQNPDLLLRPGLRGSLVIRPGKRAAKTP